MRANDQLVTPVAYIQGEDYYSESFCNSILENNLSWEEFLQYRGIVTDQYKLIRYPIKDIWIKMPEEIIISPNDIDETERKRLIELAGEKFIDIFNEKRYVNTVNAYKKIGILDDDGQWIKAHEAIF